jgi:hypothetical protein
MKDRHELIFKFSKIMSGYFCHSFTKRKKWRCFLSKCKDEIYEHEKLYRKSKVYSTDLTLLNQNP